MAEKTNEKLCLLSQSCKLAGDEQSCNSRCSSFVQLHGLSGKGGRSGAAGAPNDYKLVTPETSPARTSQPEAYKKIDAYVKTFARQFEEGARIKSLYLFSEQPGNGKTTSAAACLNAYLIAHYIGSKKRGLQPLTRPSYFLDVNEWQTLFNEFNRRNIPQEIAEPASREYYRRMKSAKETPFVVLDDIGVRSASEAFRGDLHAVINHRVTNSMPTVYTSNIALESLSDVFDERLYDRIRDLCFVVNFKGASQRGSQRGIR